MDLDFAEMTTRWYEHHARDLPWRRPDATPWAVLVSEFMLQQTPVSRVLPVWQEWLDRWPTPGALAAEPAAEAIRAWGRLGYPRRALRLHGCATAIVDRYHGEVPSSVDELLGLPGVGSYTARAVAAFAFGQRVPVVDTNVRRVLARALDGRGDAGPATTVRDLAAVEALLPAVPAQAARASVAFMELGALVCTARQPRCAQCPLATGCAWRLAGQPAEAGPSRRRQRYAGTDRQVRGLLLAVLRETSGPVPAAQLDSVWHLAEQRDRALASLLADGLVHEVEAGWYALAGQHGPG
ncbi:MAG TPA: A/G-specific adenine glycosylase [Micromonosporaceae bacterium]